MEYNFDRFALNYEFGLLQKPTKSENISPESYGPNKEQ
tara:strand:- start:2930 stop:3043 length:114 start_codon:yes stop_codon:yes gene_type:complete